MGRALLPESERHCKIRLQGAWGKAGPVHLKTVASEQEKIAQ